MTAIWTFESGRLIARNEAGELLRWWFADEATGWAFVCILSQVHSLGRLLLWPLLEEVGGSDYAYPAGPLSPEMAMLQAH